MCRLGTETHASAPKPQILQSSIVFDHCPRVFAFGNPGEIRPFGWILPVFWYAPIHLLKGFHAADLVQLERDLGVRYSL
jgi:hypothetical protein